MLAGIVAGGAFLISFILGLCGRTPFIDTLLRALVFGASFFGIVAGIYFLYNKFLSPEATDKLENEDDGSSVHGIDYSIGDDGTWLNNTSNVEKEASEEILEISENSDLETQEKPVENQATDDFIETLEAGPQENYDIEAVNTDASGVEDIKNADSGDIAYEVLEQSNNKIYNENGDSTLTQKVDDSSNSSFEMDMTAFMPGIPGLERNEQEDSPLFTPNRTALSERTVRLSVDSKSGKSDFDFDREKMAGAIQTLLKKDEG
jgi:hypothetical protein